MYTIENKDGIKTFLHMVKSAGTSIHAGIIQASTNYKNYKVHVNQRHACIHNLPEQYQNFPKYIVIRDPESWYRSFYRFFLGVEGYLSWALTDPGKDEYIYPISPDEFVRRMQNMKDTLIKYPNKARVFRNLLRSQGHMHFVTGYFQSDFHPEEPETMEQFNCSLYEWFWKNAGGNEAINIPMDRLDIVEKLFNIRIPHANRTDPQKPNIKFSPETKQLIREKHKDFYSAIENFDEELIWNK